MSKKRWLQLSAVALLIVVGLGIFFLRQRLSPPSVNPKRGQIVEAIYSLGKVKSRRRYEIKIAVLTTVEKLYVREGDSVNQGDPVVKFSETALFRAPFNAVATDVPIFEGEPVTPNTPILRLEDPVDNYIEVSLEQQGALRVQKGQEAEVVFESVRGEKLKGHVSTLFSKDDEFLAHIEVPGLKRNVLPGMTADVAIIVGRNPNALLIPVSAVNNGYVVIIRDGRRQKIPVQLGGIDGQMAEVISGDIKESDKIAIGKKS